MNSEENQIEEKNQQSKTIDIEQEKIKKISKVLSQKNIKYTAFDNMATNRKKININDCLPNNEKVKRKGRNQLFDKISFPLINLLSNRKTLNNSNTLMKSMLTEQDLPKEEENIISSKSYIKPIKGFRLNKKLPLINNSRNPILERQNRYYKRINETVSIKPINNVIIKNNDSDESLSKQLSLFYKRMRENYKESHLKSHLVNISNQSLIKKKNGIDNYVLNAYKIKKKDDFLDLIRKDTSRLKYNSNLKLNPNLI